MTRQYAAHLIKLLVIRYMERKRRIRRGTNPMYAKNDTRVHRPGMVQNLLGD